MSYTMVATIGVPCRIGIFIIKFVMCTRYAIHYSHIGVLLGRVYYHHHCNIKIIIIMSGFLRKIFRYHLA